MASENTSCWKKTPEGSDFCDKFTAFIDTPFDQHIICFEKTMADFGEFMKEKLSFGSANGDCADADGASCAKEIPTPPAAKATTSHEDPVSRSQ